MSQDPTRRCICGTLAPASTFSRHFDVFTCPRCGTQQFHARPGVEAPKFEYTQANDKYSQPEYLHGKELRWSHHELLTLDWHGRKVAEIGCFNGFFLDELRSRGADVHGVDVNEAALAAGRARFALQGRLHADIDELRKHAPFDDIVCIDVVEHVDDPADFLAMVTGLLAESGRLHLAGPTIERRFFDKSDYPPHHRWRFSRPGLARFLELGGYRVEQTRIQHDAVLMLRNWIGKSLQRGHDNEFFGQVAFAPPAIKSGPAQTLYRWATRVGEVVFKALGFSYCSTVLVATRAGRA
jgi:SAM-dependent methyltransferase